jgi:nitric oxide dioxygenase
MLSQASRPYIDASVPVLRQHGLTITRRFYDAMFAAHPELKRIFNLGNQASGAQQQSLAAALFAYAANIDNADALAPVASRIAHKHASIGITAEHYPIVAAHLLAAIAEVLGDAATPALLSAWEEAYWLLARQLIAAETQLNHAAGVSAGQMRTLCVSEVRPEADDVLSVYLRTDEGGSPGHFQPGQYVSVAVDFPDGGRQIRQYSLSDAPERDWWRLTIKREAAGAETPAGQVSNWLHQTLQPGSRLAVGQPFGDFTPDLGAATPVVLLSAGVGITPMISILNTLAARDSQRPVVFGHACRSATHHALQADLALARLHLPNLVERVFYEMANDSHPTRLVGRLALDRLGPLPANADYWLCGPLGFMREQWLALIEHGIDASRIRRELFGPEMLDHLL